MNWLDYGIIIIAVAGAFFGIRLGFIRAGFTALAIILGMFMVSQVTDQVAAWISSYVTDERMTKIIGYGITITVSAALAAFGAALARKCVYALFLGWTDRLTGLALGLAVAMAFSAAAIVAMADLAAGPEVQSHVVESPEAETGGEKTTVWESTWKATGVRDSLAQSLVQSAFVPTFIGLTDSFPARGLSFVPSDLRLTVDNLKQEVN